MAVANSETIVVVEEDRSDRRYLNDLLTHRGYECESFEDSLTALRWLSAAQYQADIVLSVEGLPGMNGLDLLRSVKAMHPALPVILLSSFCDLGSATDAMMGGASDYLLKPANAGDITQLISRHLNPRQSDQLRSAREALRQILKGKFLSGGSSASQLIPVFDLLGLKRFETFQHSRRVAAFSLLIAKRMQKDSNYLTALELGSLLHDVGKSGIPYNILMKPGKLDAEERRIIQMHPQLGGNLLAGIPGMELETEIVLYHHERFDGAGYPCGLSGYQIPFGARLFAVADTFDSITADRCYRKGQDIAVARAEICRMSGTQFDPAIVACLETISDGELEEIRMLYPEQEDSDNSVVAAQG